jgi:hypothetical protein
MREAVSNEISIEVKPAWTPVTRIRASIGGTTPAKRQLSTTTDPHDEYGGPRLVSWK